MVREHVCHGTAIEVSDLNWLYCVLHINFCWHLHHVTVMWPLLTGIKVISIRRVFVYCTTWASKSTKNWKNLYCLSCKHCGYFQNFMASALCDTLANVFYSIRQGTYVTGTSHLNNMHMWMGLVSDLSSCLHILCNPFMVWQDLKTTVHFFQLLGINWRQTNLAHERHPVAPKMKSETDTVER